MEDIGLRDAYLNFVVLIDPFLEEEELVGVIGSRRQRLSDEVPFNLPQRPCALLAEGRGFRSCSH